MDRDKRWERLQKGYDAIVRGVGVENADPVAAVEASYAQGVTDEFVEPVVCDKDGMIHSGDSVIFMNFRPDRAREMTWALTGNLPADAAMSCEKLDALLRLHRAVRRGADSAHRLPARAPRRHHRRVCLQPRHKAVPRRRDREIRPRHLLPQRRR